MVRIGLIGYGHWGPNHVRVFSQFNDSCVLMIADADRTRLEAARQQFPTIEITPDHQVLFQHPDIDAVVIATPVATHYGLVKAALLAGKDVLVGKPITYTAAEAGQLVGLAHQQGQRLMWGHVFLFNPGIRKLRQYIEEGTIGRVYYMAATRTNLGPLRRDVNALYDLGSHDISIFSFLLGAQALDVGAWGECFLQHELEDVTFA